MENPLPPPFLQNGVAQIAIVVKNLEQTVEAYWELGIGPWHFYTFGKPFVKEASYHGQPSDATMRAALAYIGPTRIELIEVGEGESIYADFVRQHGYGVHHLGFVVEDYPAALEQAAGAGLSVIQDGYGHGETSDGAYAYLDTEEALGTTFELIRRPRVRAAPEKIYPPPEET